MADETAEKIKKIITCMLTESHIDEMTAKWLSQTPNRSVGSVLEFQQNEPQNQQKIVTPVNNKVAAISKMMELPGDK